MGSARSSDGCWPRSGTAARVPEEKPLRGPAHRLRGLDDLHASACPRCGHLVRSYFLPPRKATPVGAQHGVPRPRAASGASAWARSVGLAPAPPGPARAHDGGAAHGFWADVLQRHDIPVPVNASAAPGAPARAGAAQARAPRAAGVRGGVRRPGRCVGGRRPGDRSTPDTRLPTRRGADLTRGSRRSAFRCPSRFLAFETLAAPSPHGMGASGAVAAARG